MTKITKRRLARSRSRFEIRILALPFKILLALVTCGLVGQLALVVFHDNIIHLSPVVQKAAVVNPFSWGRRRQPSHFFPILEPLPALAIIEDTYDLVEGTLDGTGPTITGIAIVLQRFLLALHRSTHELAQEDPTADTVIATFFGLVQEMLLPLDVQYRGRTIFPVRADDSVYVSVASFRDHLLGATLKDAFGKAKNPEKLFIGAIVQNCFGIEFTCKTGAQVVGKDKNGRDKTKVSDARPDANGVEEFCNDPEFEKYCGAGQIRALYVNETEAVGPTLARYFASKLWGGETYYIQIDSHLVFAKDCDARYVAELKATGSYPKSVLSAYPPGFKQLEKLGDSPGTKLCRCEFSPHSVEHQIIRINTGKNYPEETAGGVPAPTQIAFMAAGFFMARAEFLRDVPFDPMLPWCFMGEEISLSMRAWTSGWNLYAPRTNLIAHEYRPGRMGLPKFWGSVGRTFGKPGPGFSNRMQDKVIQRVKHLVGYPEASSEIIERNGDSFVLTELEHYGLGTIRTWEDYIKLTEIDFDSKKCNTPLVWCNEGELL